MSGTRNVSDKRGSDSKGRGAFLLDRERSKCYNMLQITEFNIQLKEDNIHTHCEKEEAVWQTR